MVFEVGMVYLDHSPQQLSELCLIVQVIKTLKMYQDVENSKKARQV